jgi:hypothetical protein
MAQVRFNQELADSGALGNCKKAAAGNGSCTVVARTPVMK